MNASEKQKMLTGQLYHADDAEIQADQADARNWMDRYIFLFDPVARRIVIFQNLHPTLEHAVDAIKTVLFNWRQHLTLTKACFDRTAS